MQRLPTFAPPLIVLAAACNSGGTSPEREEPPAAPLQSGEPGPADEMAPDEEHVIADPWSAAFEPPLELVTERVRLEPLAPSHVELDFEALMGSREHLQRTLSWGDWPRADFTLEENRGDLERHWGEFERREAYAYTVLAPDRERCVGCIYLNPFPAGAGLPDDMRAGMLAFWVIEEELATDLDRHLVSALLDWFGETWPLDLVASVPRDDDARGVALLEEAGLAELDSPRPGTRMFVWEAP